MLFLWIRSAVSLAVLVCLGDEVKLAGAPFLTDDDECFNIGVDWSMRYVFSDSAETKDFSLSDGGELARVTPPITREGINGDLGGGIAFKALLCGSLCDTTTYGGKTASSHSIRSVMGNSRTPDSADRPLFTILRPDSLPLVGSRPDRDARKAT